MRRNNTYRFIKIGDRHYIGKRRFKSKYGASKWLFFSSPFRYKGWGKSLQYSIILEVANSRKKVLHYEKEDFELQFSYPK